MKTRLLIIITFGIIGFVGTPYSYASCSAPPLFGTPGPCFDTFSVSADTPLTEKSIMEKYGRNIELNYEDWQMSDRNWGNGDVELELPAIICTEFVVDGVIEYRMAKWVDSQTISSFENHKDDSLCDKWLAPIDDGVKIKWNQSNYLSNDTGIVKVIDKEMNLDNKKIDSFEIHVWSDTDHTGIQLRVTETDESSGTFEGAVFFTTIDESSGVTLLVEDAVYAEHKLNVNSSRIINEYQTPSTTNQLDENEKQFPDGIIDDKCKPDMYGNIYCDLPQYDNLKIILSNPYAFLLAFVIPSLIIGIIISVIIWRKRK